MNRFGSPYADIEDYAIIGDCRTASLISRSGSLDWLCLPQFDSPSVFNRYWIMHEAVTSASLPQDPSRVIVRIMNSTAVLLTEFRTDSGVVRVTDCMPVMSEERKKRSLTLWRSVLRYLEGVEGTVRLQICCRPWPDYARVIPMFRSRGKAGYCADLGDRLFHFSTDLSMSIEPGGYTHNWILPPAGARACGYRIRKTRQPCIPSSHRQKRRSKSPAAIGISGRTPVATKAPIAKLPSHQVASPRL